MSQSEETALRPSEVDVDLLFAEAIHHRIFGREAEALSCLRQLLDLESTHLRALNELGLVQLAKGELEVAAECFERILIADPKDPYALNYLSMIYLEQGELEAAHEGLLRGLKVNPHNPHLLTQRALVAHRMGTTDEAAESLRRARRHRNLGNQIAQQAQTLTRYMAPGIVIAGLSHEIKNVLESTNIALELLRDDLSDLLADPSAREKTEPRLDRLEANMERIFKLVRHFREAIGEGRSELRVLQVSELVNFAFELLGTKFENSGIRWAVVEDLPGDMAPILANRLELEQVFINLISNAYDALLEAETEEPSIRVEISSESDGRGIFVRVADNGPGIREDIATRLFELAATSKPSGTGVGLWFCSFAVERADGRIELESTGPKGTVFRMYFPTAGDQDD